MNLILQAEADPHIEIGKLDHAISIRATCIIALPAHQYTGMTQSIALIKEEVEPLVTGAVGLIKYLIVKMSLIPEWLAFFGDYVNMGKYSADLRVIVQVSHLLPQLARFPDIIRMLDGDIFASGCILESPADISPVEVGLISERA
jgi:hypothetical protein